MADEKKGGDDGMGLGAIILWGLVVLFVMWIISGGPERTQNKYNPFIEPLVEPLGDGSVYGEGGIFQEGVEDILTEGVYKNWKLEVKNNFSFLTPPQWSSTSSGGFGDTEFGTITDGDIVLTYQYGREANTLNFENNPDYEVVYGKVHRRKAKFVRPLNAYAETTGAYIKKNKRKRISIFTNQELTPEQEKKVFEIINTVRI